MADAYAEAISTEGHEPLLRDLYALGFEPRLAADEIPGPKGFAPHEDVMAERALLQGAGVFALFYPVWFNAPPAILKGYLDRVFGMGFGYGMGQGGNTPLLTGKRMISFTSSGAPSSWLKESGAWDAMRKLFDEHVAGVCGLAVLDHVHFGGIVPNITGEAVDACAEDVSAAALKHFLLPS
jgi:NAD(P)H dehydrogenase (quinone)